jgi:hypothetical protein
MKNLFFSILLSNISMMAFGQSIMLSPSSSDEILVTRYGSNPNFLSRRSNGTSAAPTATLTDSHLLSLGGRGYTTSFLSVNNAEINFKTTQAFSSGNYGTQITFHTTSNGTTTLLPRMLISHDGKVGIGDISTPTAKLQVHGDFALSKTLTISGNLIENSLNRGGASIINITSGTLQIGGIAGGEEGMILYIFKDDAVLLDIFNDYANAPSGNRIFTSTGATFHSNAGTRIGGIALIYVGNYWRIVSQ